MNWSSLESLPGLVALQPVWQAATGDQFAAFRSLCLQPSAWQVQGFPCPLRCGCVHSVILRHDHTAAVAICRCNPPTCPDIPLTLPEITPLEVNRPRLGRALRKAFGLTNKFAELPSPNTFQFGAWSTDAVPAILTIQVQNSVFRRAVAEIDAYLRQPFILFAPTSDFLDAPSQATLQNHGAAFFSLDARVLLTEQGTLHPRESPGELFARFTPQPKEIDEDIARRAFALVQQLDIESRMKLPAILTVFRLYCIEELSVAHLARKCRCSTGTIVNRLNLIRARTGLHPRDLRRISSHLANLEAAISDPRAAHIHRKNLITNDPDPADSTG